MRANISSPYGGRFGPRCLVGLLLFGIAFSARIPGILCTSARLPPLSDTKSTHSSHRESLPPNMYNTVYFSDSRGNDTGGLCTFEEPCQSLQKVLNRLWPPKGDIYAVYLTGHYDLTEFVDTPPGYEWDFFHIVGQPDCWPSNATDCGASLPIFDSIRVSKHAYLFAFTLESIIIRPNIIVQPPFHGASDCYGAVEVAEQIGILSASLINSFIDASGTNGCLSINSALGGGPFNPFQLVNITILNVPDAVDSVRLYVNDLIGGGWPPHLAHDVFISNVALDPKSASYSKLRLSVRLPPHSTMYISDMDLAFFMHNLTNGFNQTMHLKNVSLSHFESTWCQDYFIIENCTFDNVLLNMSGSGCTFDSGPTQPSRNITVINSRFQRTTLFTFAVGGFIWHNTFSSAASTRAGVHLPPVTSLYLGLSAFGPGDPKPGLTVAKENYWGHPSGPTSCCNPSGLGLPVLWLTDFSSWCLDELCTQIASRSQDFGDENSLKNQSLDSIPTCFYETICTEDTIRVMWISLGAEGALIISAVIAGIVISCLLSDQPDVDRYKRLTTVVRFQPPKIMVACILLLLSIAFGIEAAILPQLNASVDNTVVRFSASATETSMNVLVAFCAIMAAFAIGVLVVVNRRHPKKPFYGLRFIFICVVVLTISMVYSGFMAQMMPVLIKQSQMAADNRFPDIVLSPLVREGLIPTLRGWAPWIKAAVGFLIVMTMLGITLWQLLRIRDFVEVETILDEIAYRSPLLGLAPGQLARGDDSFAKNSRRLAWFLFLPFATTITTGLLQLKYQLNFASMQQVEESIIFSLGTLFCITGFFAFYRFYYRVVLLWLHVAVWSFQAVGMLSPMGFWFLKTTNSVYSEFPIPIYVFAILDLILYSAMAIYGAVVIKRLSPRLASGLNQNLKDQMDEMFENE